MPVTDTQSLPLTVSAAGGTVSVTVHGPFETDRTPLFRQLLIDLVEGETNLDVSIDVSGVSVVDADTVSALVEIAAHVEARGGRLFICNAADDIADQLSPSSIEVVRCEPGQACTLPPPGSRRRRSARRRRRRKLA